MTEMPWRGLGLLVAAIALGAWQSRRMTIDIASMRNQLESVATRLGFTVTEGNPRLDLARLPPPHPGDFLRRSEAQGAPFGRPCGLTVVDGIATAGVDSPTPGASTPLWSAVLEAELAVEVPAFELCLQGRWTELELAERLASGALFDVSPPDPAMAHLLVHAADPRVVTALTPALPALYSLQVVHLAGEGRRIWTSFPRLWWHLALGSLQDHVSALETAARALETGGGSGRN